MINIKSLLCPGERIFSYGYTGSYCTYCCIIPEGSTNISGALEDTLHRILEAGGTPEDVCYILGAFVPTEAQWKEFEEFDEYTEIDLGYVIPGLLIEVK